MNKFKLLIDAPTGIQEIVEIYQSGGYFDNSRVLFDERKDGPLNIEMGKLGGYKKVGNSLSFDQAKFDADVIIKNQRKSIGDAANANRAKIRDTSKSDRERLGALIKHLGLDT